MADYVWDQTLDDGAYRARVERTGERTGQLIVTRAADDEVLLNEGVHLAWGAQFGPDIDDVQDWQAKTIAAVDGA